jgi:hypothetical protein
MSALIGADPNNEMAERIETGAVTKLLFWEDLPPLGNPGEFLLDFGNGSWWGGADFPTRVAGQGQYVFDSDGLAGHPPSVQECSVDGAGNFQCTGSYLTLPLVIAASVSGELTEVSLRDTRVEGQYSDSRVDCDGLCSVDEASLDIPPIRGGFRIGGLLHLDDYFDGLNQTYQSCVCFGDGDVQLFEYGEGATEYEFACSDAGNQAVSDCPACTTMGLNYVCGLTGPIIIGAAEIDSDANGIIDSFSVGVRMGVSGAEIVACSGSNCVPKENLMFEDGFEDE